MYNSIKLNYKLGYFGLITCPKGVEQWEDTNGMESS
jgi:hypothetical protein